MTDLDWPPVEPDPSAIEREPRKCRHPRWQRQSVTQMAETFQVCGACGHVFDPAKQRQGRNARLRGKNAERKEMRLAGRHTGNANKADDGQSVDGMFAYQSKSRVTRLFPGWQQLELDKLRIAHPGKVPVLVIIEAPGAGHKPRKIAILDWSEWLNLHGKATP